MLSRSVCCPLIHSVGRYAEFGLAVAERALEGITPPMKYFGVLRPDQREVPLLTATMMYESWDRSPNAPPKQRPTEP